MIHLPPLKIEMLRVNVLDKTTSLLMHKVRSRELSSLKTRIAKNWQGWNRLRRMRLKTSDRSICVVRRALVIHVFNAFPLPGLLFLNSYPSHPAFVYENGKKTFARCVEKVKNIIPWLVTHFEPSWEKRNIRRAKGNRAFTGLSGNGCKCLALSRWFLCRDGFFRAIPDLILISVCVGGIRDRVTRSLSGVLVRVSSVRWFCGFPLVLQGDWNSWVW